MSMKPILFNTEMVKALLEGRKTVTRRLVKPQPGFFYDAGGCVRDPDNPEHIAFLAMMPDDHETIYVPPYQPDDILYVRETWAMTPDILGEVPGPVFMADFTEYELEKLKAKHFKWKPSIHMPKDIARIFCRVKRVSVERLQDITEADAIREGVPDEWPMNAVYCPVCQGEGLVGDIHPGTLGYMEVDCPRCAKATQRFANLWDSTIKTDDLPNFGWVANPWVWVIEFERCEKPEEG